MATIDSTTGTDWQGEQFVVVADLGDDSPWITAAVARRVVRLLAAAGWDVEIREPRGGEAEGTYYRRGDGTLQLLGYSVDVPRELTDALTDAVNAAL